MANNKIQVKRTSVSGRTANVTSSGNSQYIDAGELALNMADGILYSSNGSTLITVGSNLVNQNVTNTLTVAGATTVNSSGISSTQTVSGLELTSTFASGDEGGQINLAKPPNATTSGGVVIDAYQNKIRIYENGGNFRGAYIDITAAANGVGSNLLAGGGGGGTVTSVDSGSGLTGGPITGSGTLSVLANNGIIANSSGTFVNANTGLVVNTAGVFVNSGYIATLTANNTSFVGTVSAANVVSNAQLSSNLSNYQTTSGLSANVATLTANNTSFVGTVSAANVVSNAQLSANLSNYQTTAGLSANVAKLTANNANNLGGVAAASYVQNTDSRTLSGNLVFSGANVNFTNGVVTFSSTSAIKLPAGTAVQRPTGVAGQIRFNSDTNQFEGFNGVSWGTINVSGLANEVPAGSNTAPAIYSTGDNNTGLFFPAADTVAVTTGGTERMRINSSGDVGIGTSSPSVRLDVRDSIASVSASTDSIAYFGNEDTTSTATTRITLRSHQGDSLRERVHLEAGLEGVSGGYLGIWTRPTGSGITEKVRVTASGNVGINTTAPAVALHVIGNAILEGTSPNIVLAETDTTDQDVRIRAQDGCTLFETVTDARAQVRENMRIDASGNLLVGNTAINGEEGLTIRPGVSVGAAQITFNRATTTSSSSVIIFRNALAAAGSIAHTNTTTTYNTSSDYRLKENIEPMQNALDIVAQLNPVTYTWKADGSVGQGFIAHELQAIVPDCVTGEKDAIDEDGNPEYQGIDTSFLVATLVKAIQEQQATIEALTSRIETLEAK